MMKTRIAIVMLLTFVSCVLAFADGCYVPKIDKASYAKDIYEPSQKAIICHFGNKERLVLQVSYKGNAKEFCWLIPTPSRPAVDIVNEPYFNALHECTAPEIVYWRDSYRFGGGMASAGGGGIKTQVEVIEQKTVGDYDVSVVRARDSSALLLWLAANGYRVTERHKPVFEHYLKRRWFFTAARISTPSLRKASSRLREGVIAPLRLDFSSKKPIYPLKISSLNPGRTKILLYFIGKMRMDCPGFRTDCFMANSSQSRKRTYHLWYYYWYLDRLWSGYIDEFDVIRPTLTKLSATLSAEEMTMDLTLTPAVSQKEILPKPVSPPFMENLGASIGYVVVVSMFYLIPYTFIIGLLGYWGTELKWKKWFGNLVIASIAYYCVMLPLLFVVRGNTAFAWSTVAVAAIGISYILILIRRRMNRQKQLSV